MATVAPSNQTIVKSRMGHSLIALTVVVVIVGVLAVIGVPHLRQSAERSRSAEAFEYLAAVGTAQEQYQVDRGTYATDFADLDMSRSPPTYFTVPATITASKSSWSLQLTRAGANAGDAPYTITFDQDGYVPNMTVSSIPAYADPRGTILID